MKYEIYFKTWSLYDYNDWTDANMCTYQQLNAIYIYAGQNHYHICFSELFVGHVYTIKKDLNIAEKNDFFAFYIYFWDPYCQN